MKKAVIIVSNDCYVARAIISLRVFHSKNNEYDMFILGTSFSESSHTIAKKYKVQLIEKNLEKYFFDLDKRPYGHQYPIECFYRFYVPEALPNYDFVVVTEPDIYTNKPLSIDLREVTHIAGSHHPSKKIKGYSPIMNDIPKWKKSTQIQFHLDQFRVLGGISVMNVKNLRNIKFFEKITKLYKRSWDLKAPRCGDDSLMVLFQAIYPDYVKVYPNHFHTIEETDIRQIPNITFFHTMGKFIKYWKRDTPFGEINKYINGKFIQYLYNHFELDYIKKFFPTLYVDINKVQLTFHYFTSTPNFGDMLVPYMLEKIDKNHQFDCKENKNPKILSIGSVMRIANEKTIVYGSGIRDKNQMVQYSNAQFVRGPRTREALLKKNVYTPPVYGDLGLLMPNFYHPKIKKKYSLGIIPHYVDYQKAIELYGHIKEMNIIDVKNKNIEKTIDEILSCRKIVSSSLHGLIISDAYHIPNKWIQFSHKIKGDNTKFYDYFESVNRKDQVPITNFHNKLKLNNLIQRVQSVNISFNKKEIEELLFFNLNGFTPYSKYLFSRL